MIWKTSMVFLLSLFIVFFSYAQHTVLSNEIFVSADNKSGVKASTGEVLIEPLYMHIMAVGKNARLRLPPPGPGDELVAGLLDYYIVINEAREKALFDANGNVLVDFCPCRGFQIDEHTKTIVVERSKGDYKNSLHTLKGKPILNESFEGIGFINDSDLIALIKHDGSLDEFYLYNPFTNTRVGPYDHFNIYNKDFDPTMGIKSLTFEKLIEPLGISVRNEKKWGFVSMTGKEILPMKFGSFRWMTDDVRKTYIKLSNKPEGIEFMFYARLKADRTQLIFIDKQLNEYAFTRDVDGNGIITLMQ